MANIIRSRYELGELIGSGTFGDVYSGRDIFTNRNVAIKMAEHPDLNLRGEYGIYRALKHENGIPQIFWYGRQNKMTILIMEKLGPSLADLLTSCNGFFTTKTVGEIGFQLMWRIESVHNKNIIHRDIKPENFLIGVGNNSSLIYIIDFGLARHHSFSDRHIRYRTGVTFSGTAAFASINAMSGIVQSRRDDMEAIGYMLIYFQKGNLPWLNIDGSNNRQVCERVCEMKSSIPLGKLCKNWTIELLRYMQYCRSLCFDQRPDYFYLRSLFHEMLSQKLGSSEMLFKFDWENMNNTQQSKEENDYASSDS